MADVGITMITRSVNSMGLGIAGGGSLDDALTELKPGRADAVVVLENDLHRPRRGNARECCAGKSAAGDGG